MIIGADSLLLPYTRIVNCNKKDMAFKWIDPIKRIGIQLSMLDFSTEQIASLEWTEEKPFPYDIIISDPITKEIHINPCLHELDIIEKNASIYKEIEHEIMIKSYKGAQAWQEANK